MNTPRLPNQRPPRHNSPTVLIALLVGFVLVAAFFGLLAVIIPGAAQMGGAVVVLALFFGLQYFVWGKWLYPYVVRKEREQQALQKSDDSQNTD